MTRTAKKKGNKN